VRIRYSVYGMRPQNEAATARSIMRSGGFTLLEVVLAISIAIGMLLVLLFFYQQAANLRGELIGQAERVSTVRLVMDRITAELRTARSKHAFYSTAFVGDSESLQFFATGDVPRSAWFSGERVTLAHTDLKFVRYSAQAHAEGTNTAVKALFRTEEPLVENRKPAAHAGAVELDTEAKRPEPLSEEIRFVRFRYWDGKAWLESWAGGESAGIPAGVEITLGFEVPAVDEGANALPNEVFRRVVYLPGSGAAHPELKLNVSSTNEVVL
jgi:type II secretory pathway component PulJ